MSLLPADLVARLAAVPAAAARLGGRPADWTVREVGDGNVNFVYVVAGPAGCVCAKRAVPYVRVAGEAWPLTAERVGFEHRALREHRRHVGPLVPEPIHYDPAAHLLVVECLDRHRVLRHGLVAGERYPRLADQMAEYLARSLFCTSDLGMPAAEKRLLAAEFTTNVEMCRIMEDMVFTDPYVDHPRNRWTSPQMDAAVAALRDDVALKAAVSRAKVRYLTSTEALLHGDLHTGSVMVAADDTRVIDQEFACYGPIGFDVGTLLAHLVIAAVAEDGLAAAGDRPPGQQAWLLDTVVAVWDGFARRFLDLWEAGGDGDAYPAAMFAGAAGRDALAAERRAHVRRLLADSLAFCGAEILRRVFGFARALDLESIPDPDLRAGCERRCAALARDLLVHTDRFRSVDDVCGAVAAGLPGSPV